MTLCGNATSLILAYDVRSRLQTITDQAKKVTTKNYDDLNRLSSVVDAMLPVGQVTTYTYDGDNNLTSVQDANGHTSKTRVAIARFTWRHCPESQWQTAAGRNEKQEWRAAAPGWRPRLRLSLSIP